MVFERDYLPKIGGSYPQDSEENEYRFIEPKWLDEVAKGLTKGAVKHPGKHGELSHLRNTQPGRLGI